MIRPQFTKFGDHRHYGSEDKMVFSCQLITEDYVVKVSSDCMGGSLSWWVLKLKRLVDIGIVVVEM